MAHFFIDIHILAYVIHFLYKIALLHRSFLLHARLEEFPVQLHRIDADMNEQLFTIRSTDLP